MLFEGYMGPWDSHVGWGPGSPFGITGAVTFLVSQSFLGSEKLWSFQDWEVQIFCTSLNFLHSL